VLNSISVVYSFGRVSDGRWLWILVTHLVAGVSIYGIWRMQLWGPILYLGGQVVGIVAYFAVPPEGAGVYPVWAVFLIPILVAIPLLIHWREFRGPRTSQVSNA
jgi:hypothetical protein